MMITAATLLGLAWKSAIIAGLTLLLLRLARSRSAGERSLIAHAGLAALLLLPVATLALPEWAPLPADWVEASAPAMSAPPAVVEAPPAAAAQPGAAAPAMAADSKADAGWTLPAMADLAIWVYSFPLFLLALLMTVAVVRLFAMRGRADVLVQPSWLSALAEAQRRMGFKHGTALLVSNELRSPISWGVVRPTIVLNPAAVDAVAEAEAIIAHELAHVARLDWAKLLAARLACALFWFNPLVWMLARESHQLREEAADDAVLLADIDGPDYASLLVGAARHDNQGALLAAHGVAPAQNSLKRRITRVLDGSLKRGPASASWVLMSLVLLAGVSAPLAAFSATATPSASGPVHTPVATAPAAALQSAAAVGSAGERTDKPAPATARKPLSPDDLVGMRAVGVTPDDVRKMRESGHADADDIIAAKATGVDPAYINAMRRVFPNADVGDLVGAKAVGIDPAYARDMRRYFPDVNLDDLTAMRAMGVTGDYVRQMRAAGRAMRDPDDAIEARALGNWGGAYSEVRSSSGATARIGSDGTLEARSADGKVTRISPPRLPAPPENPAAPQD